MREDVTLRDAMTREFVGVSESDTVSATAELLAAEEAEGAVVLRGEQPVGQLTATALLGAMADGADPAATPVSEVMADPPPVLPPDAAIGEAALALSQEHDWRVLVGADGGEGVAGTVDARDVLTAGLIGPENGDPDLRTVTDTEAEIEGAPSELDDRVSATDVSVNAFAEQSICEGCGALARDVRNVDGRALCANCRET
jgi:CBS domain-containing protein